MQGHNRPAKKQKRRLHQGFWRQHAVKNAVFGSPAI
jgi:hypothetical protein